MNWLDWLYTANPWLSYLVAITLLLVAGEFGHRIGIYRRRRGATSTSEISTLEGAFLGLLALILGFTFSIAVNRFDTRKGLLVDEANAIGTTDLRARMLPDAQSGEVRGLLRDYVQLRIELFSKPPTQAMWRSEIDRSNALQERLWQQAMAASAADPHALPVSLFVQALNEMIDLQAKRIAAADNHVPEAVFVLLFLIGMVSVGFNAYAVGLDGRGGRVPNLIAIVLIATVISLIGDIDRPQGGLVTVGQKPMLDLLAGMAK